MHDTQSRISFPRNVSLTWDMSTWKATWKFSIQIPDPSLLTTTIVYFHILQVESNVMKGWNGSAQFLVERGRTIFRPTEPASHWWLSTLPATTPRIGSKAVQKFYEAGPRVYSNKILIENPAAKIMMHPSYNSFIRAVSRNRPPIVQWTRGNIFYLKQFCPGTFRLNGHIWETKRDSFNTLVPKFLYRQGSMHCNGGEIGNKSAVELATGSANQWQSSVNLLTFSILITRNLKIAFYMLVCRKCLVLCLGDPTHPCIGQVSTQPPELVWVFLLSGRAINERKILESQISHSGGRWGAGNWGPWIKSS